MNEVAGSGQAELRVFLVVARVSQIIHVAEFDQPWIFDTAIFFVIGFWRKHRLGATGEVEAIAARGIAEAGGSVLILRAIQHDRLAVVRDNGRIKGAGRLPGGALGGKYRIAGEAIPIAEQ